MGVFAKLLGDRNQTLLFSRLLKIPHESAAFPEKSSAGLYFDWGPDSSRYLHHMDDRPMQPDPEEFLELIGLTRRHQTSEQSRLDGVK
jgi:hypothetical protein